MRGGVRKGAGRKPAKPGQERKVRGFRLTDYEWQIMKYIHKSILNKHSVGVFFDDAHPDGFVGEFPADAKIKTKKEVHAEKLERMNVLQNKAYHAMLSGKNVFLSGGAGTGKSYVLRRFIETVSQSKRVLICAPTGIAARNINGVTVHRAFRVPIGIITPKMRDSLCTPKSYKTLLGKQAKVIAATDVVVIDEISMMRSDVFDYVMNIIQQEAQPHEVFDEDEGEKKTVKHHIQVVVCGDFCQLPPVIGSRERDAWNKVYPDNTHGFAFLSDFWNFETVNLQEVIRQSDKHFSTALNQIRMADEKGLTFINENRKTQRIKTAIDLCSTNKEAESINAKELAALTGKTHTYMIAISGDVKDSDINLPRDLTLKVGCRVVLSANNPDEGYYNGQFGTVTDLADDNITVRLDGTYNEVTIEKKTTIIENYEERTDNEGKKSLVKVEIGRFSQIPVKIGYAITIHRSQGQTYTEVNLHTSHIFASGQLYVALSRCKSIEHTYFYRPIQPDALMVDDDVLDFYRNL